MADQNWEAQKIAAKDAVFWRKSNGLNWEAHKECWKFSVFKPKVSLESHPCVWDITWFGTQNPPKITKMGGRAKTVEDGKRKCEESLDLLYEFGWLLSENE